MSSLIGTAIFLPQSHFIFVFVWSFLILGIIFSLKAITGKVSSKFKTNFKLSSILPIFIMVYFFIILLTSQRISSSIFFLSSILCLPLVIHLLKNRLDSVYKFSIGFLYLNIIVAAIEFPFIFFGNPPGIFYVMPEDAIISGQDYFRFRGFSLEPNHLGISLSVIYLVIMDKLFKPNAHKKNRKILSLVLIWILAYLTVSIYTMGMLFILTCLYIIKNLRLSFFLLLTMLVVGISTDVERIGNILIGADNSANLRTWGSFYLGYKQIQNCGILGCGIGSARDVLADEPEMDLFAAGQLNGLPNLIANAMVEGGIILPLIFIFFIYRMSFFNRSYIRDGYILSFGCFLILLSIAFSGSFLYDPTIWIIGGYLYSYRMKEINSKFITYDFQKGHS